MRVLHVATLVTPDGAYGGPIRVALNQLGELANRGHSVELIAGASGFDGDLPSVIQGVPVKLFRVKAVVPRTGYAGLSAPGLSKYLKEQLKRADIVHVHVARDLVTLPAAAIVAKHETPLILQPHGMIDESERRLAAIIDAYFTRKVLRRSQRVLTLTSKESASLLVVSRKVLPITAISNGVLLPELPVKSPGAIEVLFLARLHPRKRAIHFVEMAKLLIDEGSDAVFTLVGPDEGDGQTVLQLISKYGLAGRVTWEGALAPEMTLERMRNATVFVLPSVGEVMPMSVLEAMSLGLPVVVTDSNGLAIPLTNSGAGVVVDETLNGLVSGVRRLLDSAKLRAELGTAARRLIQDEYSITAVASALETIYTDTIKASQPNTEEKL